MFITLKLQPPYEKKSGRTPNELCINIYIFQLDSSLFKF